MSESLRKQIYHNLSLKETDELLKIWTENHRNEWSDTAFELIEEILDEREAEIPTQNPAIWIKEEKESQKNWKNIVDWLKQEDNPEAWQDIDENSEDAPVFYKPREALKNIRWLEIAAKIALLITPFQMFFFFINPLYNYFSVFGTSLGARVTGIVVILIFSVISGIATYLIYRAIAYILKILMEFEFNSRGVK